MGHRLSPGPTTHSSLTRFPSSMAASTSPAKGQREITMRPLVTARWRHEHRRALRLLIAAGASLTLLTGPALLPWPRLRVRRIPFGDEQVGGTYANGILLPTQQWIKPIGTSGPDRQRRPPAVLVDQPQRPVPGRADLERLHRLADHHQRQDRPDHPADRHRGGHRQGHRGRHRRRRRPPVVRQRHVAVVPADLRPGALRGGRGRHSVRPGRHPARYDHRQPDHRPDHRAGRAVRHGAQPGRHSSTSRSTSSTNSASSTRRPTS